MLRMMNGKENKNLLDSNKARYFKGNSFKTLSRFTTWLHFLTAKDKPLTEYFLSHK